MNRHVLAALALALSAGYLMPANATVIVNYFPVQGTLLWDVSWFVPTAKFTSDANYQVTEIDLALVNDSGTNGASVSLLTSTPDGAPGDVLASWQVFNLPVNDVFPLTVIGDISSVNLLAHQDYFLRVAPLDATSVDLWHNGSGLTTIYNGDSLAYSSYFAPAFEILAVPEPATTALLGAGITCVGYSRRKRSRSVS